MPVLISVSECVYGRPAIGLRVTISRLELRAKPQRVSCRADDHGHVVLDRVQAGQVQEWPAGVYEAELDTESYYSTLGIRPRFSALTLRFQVTDPDADTQLRILLTPFAVISHCEG